jgi:hypothetical protein|tara:strand:+ start:3268 stop:3474 length:207 start_codon:yes stop_codon:yes gene_type:complete
MKYISVEGHSDLVKDKRTGAILNINADFEQLRKNKQKRKQQEHEFEKLKDDVNQMKVMLELIAKKMEI